MPYVTQFPSFSSRDLLCESRSVGRSLLLTIHLSFPVTSPTYIALHSFGIHHPRNPVHTQKTRAWLPSFSLLHFNHSNDLQVSVAFKLHFYSYTSRFNKVLSNLSSARIRSMVEMPGQMLHIDPLKHRVKHCVNLTRGKLYMERWRALSLTSSMQSVWLFECPCCKQRWKFERRSVVLLYHIISVCAR